MLEYLRTHIIGDILVGAFAVMGILLIAGPVVFMLWKVFSDKIRSERQIKKNNDELKERMFGKEKCNWPK